MTAPVAQQAVADGLSEIAGPSDAKGVESKFWFFTTNNPLESDDPKLWPGQSYLVYQLEVGDNGTPHHQGYVAFITKKRLKALKTFAPRTSWRIRRGTHEQARHYCIKPIEGCLCKHCIAAKDQRQEGPYEQGDPPKGQGHRSDLDTMVEDVKAGLSPWQLAEKYSGSYARYYKNLAHIAELYAKARSSPTKLVILWGPPETGKTVKAAQLAEDLAAGSVYWLPQPQDKTVWWDGYTGQKTVIIDEFAGWISPQAFSRIIDWSPLTLPKKGGFVNFVASQVIVTSNQDPQTWWVGLLYGMERRLRDATTIYMDTPYIWSPDGVVQSAQPIRNLEQVSSSTTVEAAMPINDTGLIPYWGKTTFPLEFHTPIPSPINVAQQNEVRITRQSCHACVYEGIIPPNPIDLGVLCSAHINLGDKDMRTERRRSRSPLKRKFSRLGTSHLF